MKEGPPAAPIPRGSERNGGRKGKCPDPRKGQEEKSWLVRRNPEREKTLLREPKNKEPRICLARVGICLATPRLLRGHFVKIFKAQSGFKEG